MASVHDSLTEEKAPKKNSEDFNALTSFETRSSIGTLKYSLMNYNLEHCSKIIKQKGGVKCLYDLYYEDEIIKSDIEKRLNNVACAMLNVESDNQVAEDLVRSSIEPCLYELIKSISWSTYYGYSITELIWDREAALNSGTYVLKNIFNRPCHGFKPLFDLKSCINLTDNIINKKVAPFGKYLLSVNEGTPESPHGDPLLSRLFWINLFRKKALTYWIKALERFGYPFLHGKTDGGKECVEALNSVLEQAREGSALTTDKDTEIGVLDAKVSTSQFKEFEDSARNRIHLAILGQNLTSEVSSGSMAAASIHQSVSHEKTKADLRHAESSLNQLARIILVLNGIPEQKVNITLEMHGGLSKDRAERDQILCSTGKVKLTEQYYKKHYDLEDGDFEIPANPAPGPVSFARSELDRLNLAERKLTPEVQELEDIAIYLSNRSESVFEIDELLNAIGSSTNKKELTEQLSALSSNPDISMEELIAEAYYYSLVKGAVSGD